MPTYQYTCADCGTPLEVVQRFSDDALTVCPTCGGSLRKVFSPVGIVFKGSGFYHNDSRSSGKHASSNGSAHKDGAVRTSNGADHKAGDATGSAGSAAGASTSPSSNGVATKSAESAGAKAASTAAS